MAILTLSDLTGMAYVFKGKPFVQGPVQTTIDLTEMDFVYQAQPFVVNPLGAPAPTEEQYEIVQNIF